MRALRAACLWGLLAALAGCQRDAPPRASTPPPYSDPPGDDERGAKAEVAPFTLEVTPRLRGSREIVLKSGDQVVTDDRIKVEVKASVDVHVYLGYCDHDSRLTISPSEGSIEAKAGELAYAPHRHAALRLDAQLGSEVLYVIASRRRLDLADPDLMEAISKVRPGAASLECGRLSRELEKKNPTKWATGSQPTSKRSRQLAPEPSEPERRRAALERGGYISWEDSGGVSAGSDRDGIVVLRYTFMHVDRLASP